MGPSCPSHEAPSQIGYDKKRSVGCGGKPHCGLPDGKKGQGVPALHDIVTSPIND